MCSWDCIGQNQVTVNAGENQLDQVFLVNIPDGLKTSLVLAEAESTSTKSARKNVPKNEVQ